MAEAESKGHRQRLRDRFASDEESSRSDEALLELLLTFAIPRQDTRPLAQELLTVFGSLPQVLSASPDDLNKIKGLGQSLVTLLKVVDSIRSRTKSPEQTVPSDQPAAVAQPSLFEGLSDEHSAEPEPQRHPASSTTPVKTRRRKRGAERKFQVSRSHLLEFNHFSRILSFLCERRDAKRISRQLLSENSGLPEGQVASLISIGASLGLIQNDDQILTPVGLLIAAHDVFFEDHGTLEWCHYKGAGSYQNLIWFDVFNHLLVEESATTQAGWQEYFRAKLSGQYTDKTIKEQVPKEVRFIVDAYLKRNFRKLEILKQSSDERLYRRRYTKLAPLVFAAMIYDFCATNDMQLAQVAEMAATPGSPAMVFGLDTGALRQQIEGIHDRGWLRYETTHNLDQLRLKPGFSAMEFLTAYFENREPVANADPSQGGLRS